MRILTAVPLRDVKRFGMPNRLASWGGYEVARTVRLPNRLACHTVRQNARELEGFAVSFAMHVPSEHGLRCSFAMP